MSVQCGRDHFQHRQLRHPTHDSGIRNYDAWLLTRICHFAAIETKTVSVRWKGHTSLLLGSFVTLRRRITIDTANCPKMYCVFATSTCCTLLYIVVGKVPHMIHVYYSTQCGVHPDFLTHHQRNITSSTSGTRVWKGTSHHTRERGIIYKTSTPAAALGDRRNYLIIIIAR